MCGGRGTGSLCDPEYWLETCMCIEGKSLSVDVYQRVGRLSMHVGMAPTRNICNT